MLSSPAARCRAYLATLTRLEPLVEQADARRPRPRRADRRAARAAAILREDRAYLEALRDAALTRRCRWPAAAPASGASTRTTSRAYRSAARSFASSRGSSCSWR